MVSPTQWTEFEQTLGDGEGKDRGNWCAAVCGGHKGLDTTEQQQSICCLWPGLLGYSQVEFSPTFTAQTHGEWSQEHLSFLSAALGILLL